MCLLTVEFGMRYWPEEDTYVGTGFKIMNPKNIKFNEWIEATGNWNNDDIYLKVSGILQEQSSDLIKTCYTNKSTIYDRYKKYPVGFHIWLNPKDAKNYLLDDYNRGVYKVFQVDFTDVLAFGQNLSNGIPRPCVISRWIYYHPTPIVVKD